MRLAFAVIILWFPLGSKAQIGDIANHPPSSGENLDLSRFDSRRAVAEPDTTAPFRYFPLEIGNEWEYETRNDVVRYKIVKDTSALSHRYFLLEKRSVFFPDVVLNQDYLRFDSTSTTVRRLSLPRGSRPDADVPFHLCALSAPFNQTVDCESSTTAMVGGGYEGAIVVGGEGAGTGADTVRTAIKTFGYPTGLEESFAADVGVIFQGLHGAFEALRYYRVGGVARGYPLFPTSDSEGPIRNDAAESLSVWPNPSAGKFNISLSGVQGIRRYLINMYDVTGKRVHQEEDQYGNPSHQLLDVSNLSAGIYLLEMVGASVGSDVQRYVTNVTVIH